MKQLIYILFLGVIVFVSCDKFDVQKQVDESQAVAIRLTFNAGFEQRVEPFGTRAASANINNLLVLIFDQNNMLTEILWNGAGNTITKVINGVPNQIYTVVYLANCRYDQNNNPLIKVGTTKITDSYNIAPTTSGIPGGDLIGYGSQKRILTTDAGTITATLTPKMSRVVLKLPLTERPANKQYLLYYKSQMMQAMSLDGKSVAYSSVFPSITETFTSIGGQYIVYMRPPNPGQGNGNLTVRVIAKNMSGLPLEERPINVIPSMIPQVGKSYLINITTKFPDATSPTRNGVTQTGTDTFTIEP